jgi:hypothetical protein
VNISTTAQQCRVCQSRLPEAFFDLGVQPLANNLRKSTDTEEPKVPLQLCRCDDCGLVQLTETVKPEILFRDYVWVSGTASTTRDYAEKFCHSVLARIESKATLQVSEVASNDGTFLKPFAALGHKVQGIDPARNIAALAEQAGIPTYAEFFGTAAATHLLAQQGPSDIVIARNVIPHVADVNDVIAGMALLLKSSGVGIIEFHDAGIIQRELHYDSVYHEHLYYFTLTTLSNLLQRHQLFLFDLTISPISGGSLVVYFSKTGRPLSIALEQHLAAETASDVNSAQRWQQFAEDCAAHKTSLRNALDQCRADGLHVVGYGASARSSTLLNYCQIDVRDVPLIADQNALKHDLLTPGTHIPIKDPEQVMASSPDVVLLLAWNFSSEITQILRQSHQFRGQIIQPLPNSVMVL